MAESTATLTLADFLLARIAEDEQVADAEVDWGVDWGVTGIALSEVGEGADMVRVRTIVRRRLLAECEAKRRIVEVALQADDASAGADTGWLLSREVMELLALPYADHPDYREEWRP